MLKDERFQSSLEPENEEKWLPLQILNTVYATPGLPEDIQTDVMKVSFTQCIRLNVHVL